MNEHEDLLSYADKQVIKMISKLISSISGADESKIPASAAIVDGSIVFYNSDEETLFSVALPVYSGGVT